MKRFGRGPWKAGIDSVRGAKLRSFWTMLGITIGVASVIIVISIGEGVKQQISGQIHHLGKNLITVQPTSPQGGSAVDRNPGLLSGLAVGGTLSAKDALIVDKTRGVEASAPLTVVTGSVRGDNGVYNDGLVIGTSADLSSLLNQSLAYGAFFTDEDSGTHTAVLGPHAAQALFNEDVPLGQSFRFHGEQFIVRGIFNPFNDTPLSQAANFNNAIFIPNDVAEDLSNNTAPTYEIIAKPTQSEQTASVAKAIERALRKAHGGQANFSVLQGNQNLAGSNSILNLLTLLIAGIAAISLLVGGIGIMNVMLVSVAERMHEIGIRKAVGATNRQILGQFMVESSFVSLIGGIIGIGLAFAVDLMLRLFTSLKPVISWQVVLLATTVSLLVGIVFGSIPAFKAARKDPIDALRSE